VLHLKLLARMVGHFYEAKQREQIQRQSAYTHAIYETGARLTHDVKNLLQSLKSLCSAAGSATPEQASALQALMQRQLPQITQRLNTTLDKLQSPQAGQTTELEARLWWENLTQRYSGRSIEFTLDGPVREMKLPADVFDSVADNLIENALNKAAAAGPLEVRVTFSTARRGSLIVCDSGAAIARSVEAQLFEGAVASNTGFGVGLYQSARLAAQSGYRLALAANLPGRVCFILSSQAVESAADDARQVA
jgi:signal transduction histidine kinase